MTRSNLNTQEQTAASYLEILHTPWQQELKSGSLAMESLKSNQYNLKITSLYSVVSSGVLRLSFLGFNTS